MTLKSFSLAMLLCSLALPVAAQAAPQIYGQNAGTATISAKQDTVSKVSEKMTGGEVNGWAWGASSNDSKLSFLLGVENAIAMEYALSQALAQQQGKTLPLSPFQEGWMLAFGNTSRQSIVTSLDAFYDTHPADRNRHVFDVIWTEMLTPALKNSTAAK